MVVAKARAIEKSVSPALTVYVVPVTGVAGGTVGEAGPEVGSTLGAMEGVAGAGEPGSAEPDVGTAEGSGVTAGAEHAEMTSSRTSSAPGRA